MVEAKETEEALPPLRAGKEKWGFSLVAPPAEGGGERSSSPEEAEEKRRWYWFRDEEVQSVTCQNREAEEGWGKKGETTLTPTLFTSSLPLLS